MKRRQFLGLLSLLGCKNDNMQFTQHGILTGARFAGLRILIIGDSIAAGRNDSTGKGSTPTAGTVKEWTGAAWADVTNQDVITSIASNGSPWPDFGIALNAYTNETVYLIPTGVSSSMFYQNAGYTTWQKGDTNYTNMLTAVNNGLGALGNAPLDAICIILGINDIVVSSTLANVESAIDQFFVDLTTDFPGVPIIVSQPGRKASGTTTTNFNDARHYAVKYKIFQQSVTYNQVFIGPNLGSLQPAGGYSADNLHPSLTGDIILGGQFARWFKNNSYSKYARSVISAMYDELSTLRKNLIAGFIDSQVANGNYFLFEQLGIFMQTDVRNYYVDISMMGGFYAPSGATFVANSHVATNGTNQHITPTNIAAINNRRSGVNDFIQGYFLKDNVAAAATSIMGGNLEAGQGQWIGQTSGVGLRYLCNDLTANTYGGELALQDNAIYALGRTGTTKHLYKEAVSVASTTQASTGATAVFGFIGARNNAGGSTVDFYFSGQYYAHWVSKHDGFDLSSFVTELRYLIAHWND